MTNYTIISATSEKDLATMVDEYLAKGFVCQGGISVTAFKLPAIAGEKPVQKFMLAQAMVKP